MLSYFYWPRSVVPLDVHLLITGTVTRENFVGYHDRGQCTQSERSGWQQYDDNSTTLLCMFVSLMYSINMFRTKMLSFVPIVLYAHLYLLDLQLVLLFFCILRIVLSVLHTHVHI